MSNIKTPFRYDFVGSFLRPEKLKKARKQFDDGEIGYEELKKVEDESITDLITKVKELGYHVITDGEFRRATWHLDFMWGFDGVGHTPTKTGLPFHGEDAMVDDTYLVGKVGIKGEHPFVEHFKFVKQFEDENTVAKQTMPSPAQFLAQFTMPFNREHTLKYYATDKELAEDIVKAYGNDWAKDEMDVDLPFVISKKEHPETIYYRNDFTNIILVFDYERHDPAFSEEKILEMQHCFEDSTDMGKLYLKFWALPVLQGMYFIMMTLRRINIAEGMVKAVSVEGQKRNTIPIRLPRLSDCAKARLTV